MKIIWISFFSWLLIQLPALTIILPNDSTPIEITELTELPQITVKTERFKHNETRYDNWTGVSVSLLLNTYCQEDYDQVIFLAQDNYQVRYERAELREDTPIIALNHNNEPLTENSYRLIDPERRDMYWIRGFDRIVISRAENFVLPRTVFLAERFLNKKTVRTDLSPFVNVSGFYFRDLIESIFPFSEGDFLLCGYDGITHILNYTTYLDAAVLVQDSLFYDLQSPDMPGGMWLKKIAYLQKDETAIIFAESFPGWDKLAEILGWDKLPTNITHYYQENQVIDSFENFKFDSVTETFELKW